MKKSTCPAIFLLAAILILSMTSFSYADDYTVEYSCSYNGSEIKTDFDKSAFNDMAASLEPGDNIQYKVTYENDSDAASSWFVKSNVFKTLEANKAKGSGCSGAITNNNPNSKSPVVLFDNTKADAKAVPLEDLQKLQSATGEYLSMGNLKAGQAGSVEMEIRFDGESEDLDFTETVGELIMQFAVENTDQKVVSQRHPLADTKTGNSVSMLLMLAFMTGSALAALFAVISFVKIWKRGDRS